jgi:hypothetical protein
VLGDAEVVEGHREEQGVGVEELVDQSRHQIHRGALLGTARGDIEASGPDRQGPGARVERLDAEVAVGDRRLGPRLAPRGLHHVGQRAAHRPLGTDAGVQAKQRHSRLLLLRHALAAGAAGALTLDVPGPLDAARTAPDTLILEVSS